MSTPDLAQSFSNFFLGAGEPLSNSFLALRSNVFWLSACGALPLLPIAPTGPDIFSFSAWSLALLALALGSPLK